MSVVDPFANNPHGSPWSSAGVGPAQQANALSGIIAQSQQEMMLRMTGLSPRSGYPPTPPTPAVDLAKLEALKNAKPHKVLRAAPDYVAPLVGWRAWSVEGWKLRAIGKTAEWEPKKAIEAQCLSIYSAKHDAPAKTCDCGVWSFSTLEKLITGLEGYDPKQVIGQVHIWGRVIECENGYRSQFAYPKELWLLDESLEQLGYIYGVPVRTAK